MHITCAWLHPRFYYCSFILEKRDNTLAHYTQSIGPNSHHVLISQFLAGPIPLDWLARSARAHPKGLHVATLLHHVSKLVKRQDGLTVHTELRLAFGLSRHSYNRALVSLEQQGLVSTIRLPGRKARITILYEDKPNKRA